MHGFRMSMIALFLLCLANGCDGRGETQSNRDVAAPAALIATQHVEPARFEITLPRKLGVLEPAEQRELAFELAGRLERVLTEGQRVAPGEVIAELDTTLERARVRQAELRLADAKSELERIRGLRRARAASSKDLESASMRAEVQETELTMAREQLARRKLSSGIAGVVIDVEGEPGELIAPQTHVATVADLSSLELVIGVPGYQVRRVQPGAAARVQIQDPESTRTAAETFPGVVERTAAAALGGQHLFEVEIRVPNPPSDSHPAGRLRPGLSAWVEIVTQTVDAALAVPLESMIERDGARMVFFAAEGRAVAVPLEDAPIRMGHILLPADLPYRELVVRGQHGLADGVSVRIDNTVLAEVQVQ